jgi:hypothetical protein
MKLRFAACALLVVSTFGCAAKTTDDRFEISLRATSDDALALAGATFATGKSNLGKTSTSGIVNVHLRGAEGQTLPLTVTCPSGYESSGELSPLRLTRTRRVGEAVAQPLTVEANCIRKLRDVVLVVRTENASNLPVLVDGKPAATTTDGTAHLLLQLDRDVRQVSVTLDTTDQPKLRPQNPSRTFELHGKDTVLVMSQAFSKVLPKPNTHATPRPHHHIPYRVQ